MTIEDASRVSITSSNLYSAKLARETACVFIADRGKKSSINAPRFFLFFFFPRVKLVLRHTTWISVHLNQLFEF